MHAVLRRSWKGVAGPKYESVPRDVSTSYSLSPPKSDELRSKASRKRRSKGDEKELRWICKLAFRGEAIRSESFLILIILHLSQTPTHMLQRTQRLLIFLPVPGTSDDKSETRRNHT